MKTLKYLIAALVILLTGSVPLSAQPALSVFASILPQQYFLQQIGRDRITVNVMVQPGASPATYEPRPSQMKALSKADLYFSIGVPFENAWLKKIAAANPEMKLIHTDQGIKKRAMAAHSHAHGEDHHGEDHHGEDHHANGPMLDPHIWLSPKSVKSQARTMLKALSQADPAGKDFYKANYQAFAEKIDELNRKLREMLKDKHGMQFMVFHPSWGYFARDFGLVQIPVEVMGKSPKPAQLKALIQHAREKKIRVVFVQPQFSAKAAALVAKEINGRVVTADPLNPDWYNNLLKVADQISGAAQ